MKRYYFMPLALLLEVLAPLALSTPSPPTPSCDQSMLKTINKFWQGAGTPQNAMKSIEASGDFVVVQTTFNFLNGENKCILMNGTSSESILSFIFTPKYDNQKVITLNYDDVEDENGFISTKRWKQRMYSIFVSNDVIVSYICTTTEGESGPPVGFIAVNRKSLSDSCAQASLKFSQGLMSLMGFEFLYEYGEECFK